ncbi:MULTISPECIES: LLM class flavin-dependent oxidoreductase [Pseudonocardia]|uniref:Limonene 1,2-monooxygenase n=2 Tax=Pseudonocardia TaxID=1847 RepID=A0A1Y2MU40_PSEAH|nr:MULTISPECIES: LLM class flavin-dependent oxidoreductase [Pseudonocardia]OSY38499.1 Limonene 1,2-monooxygenase [Pseudonocardia autotrophica]TDN77058.1 luciferase family oxidoreductase group 1 [Pseudonocardia autotrophica]BBG01064.1 luciferase-like putative monooxygenase [Pseudonocardia autotrophica]GEC26692.1 putative monooxygenase [Pseudonocardia saturnea]
MSRRPVPLSVLDLSPVPAGAGVSDALRNTLDLARAAERAGYARFWLAEHHLNPGVAGASPAVLIGAVAAATSTIRVGAGAVQTGHRTSLSVVEDFGTLDGLHPGRIDLGLGRSGARPPSRRDPAGREPRVVGGILIPAPFSFAGLVGSPRFRAQAELLGRPGPEVPDYDEIVGTVLGLIEGTHHSSEGVPVSAVPGEGADLQPWVLGSSGGDSAAVAGRRGLRFAANYHVSPGTVLDAVQTYRQEFRPSAALARPHVMVSADVVVGTDDAHAERIAAGYGPWVHSIRTGAGAIPYPAPEAAAGLPADPGVVADRLDTRFVGGPHAVADRLAALQEVTGADELLVTTITHRHADRVASQDLLAAEWARRTRIPG